MKSIKALAILLLIAFAIAALSFSGCKKEEDVCAKCIESHSLYKADDYCGPEDEVEEYVKTLKKTGASVGQDWVCVIE